MAFSGQGHSPRDEHNRSCRHDERARDDRSSRFGGETARGGDARGEYANERWSSDGRENAGGGYDHRDAQQRARIHPRSRSRSRSRSPRRYAPSHSPSTREAPPRQWAPQPSATLIIRGLTPHVSDPMLLQALASFRPTSVHVMFHKATGEHRGFAFANFDSVQTATAVMDAFASQPLIIDRQPAILAFAETNRPSPHFQRQHFNGDSGPSGSGYGGGAPPPLDWICDQCGASNFGRRAECFKCHMPKSRFAMEVPPPRPGPDQRGHPRPLYDTGGNYRGAGGRPEFEGFDQRRQYMEDSSRRDHRDVDMDEPPSHVLAVRMIPLEVDEGELQVVFARFEGVRDIRLVRDRATNQSRGFAFVEFDDVECAQRVKDTGDGLTIRGELVRVGFARETLQTRPPSTRSSEGFERPVVPTNPIAAAALEQAQWAMANNYGAMHQPAPSEKALAEPSLGLEDLDALLTNAAAAARPHIEEPKKQWPPPFETGGGMYVFKADCGLYYDTDSMFYYDPHSKIYYSSFTGQYFRCENGAFEAFTPPAPVDDSKVAPNPPDSTPRPISQLAKPVAMSLTKKDKKKPMISFNLKAPSAISSGKTASVFTSENVLASSGNGGTIALPGNGVSMAAAASASIRKKSALDIAKWSQRQEDESRPLGDAVSAKPSQPAHPIPPATAPVPPTVSAHPVDIPLEAPICLLCRRKFGSMEQLRKHETQSKLHAENLAKAKQDKDIVAAQVRERDEQEREEEQQSRKRQRDASSISTAPVHVQEQAALAAKDTVDASTTLESGIGGKMLKMMGWKKGEGLGKHGTGITAPMEAVGNTSSKPTGLGAKTTPVINPAEATTSKDRHQKMARARYDAADIHDTKSL